MPNLIPKLLIYNAQLKQNNCLRLLITAFNIGHFGVVCVVVIGGIES